MDGKDPYLVVGGLSGVFVSNRVPDAAIFGLEDFLDFSFTVDDVIVCTADGSVFDEITGLKESFKTLRLYVGD